MSVQDDGTALTIAAKKGHTECARVLLEAGADKEAKDKVLDFACYFVYLPAFSLNRKGQGM